MTSELYRITTSEEKDLAVMQIINDTLALSDREVFLGACRELLKTDRTHLIIDMRGLRRIYSIFLGTVMDVNARARQEDRRLTVIASEEVTKLFRTVVGPEDLEICQSTPQGGGKKRSSRSIRRD